jgi:ESAT-6 family protein
VTGRFRVSPEQLWDVVDQMARFDRHLESMLDDVDARVNQLHGSWEGSAAGEHRQAHAKWKRGAQEMREGLAIMRQIAMTAHGNYTDAACVDVSMWRQAL